MRRLLGGREERRVLTAVVLSIGCAVENGLPGIGRAEMWECLVDIVQSISSVLRIQALVSCV